MFIGSVISATSLTIEYFASAGDALQIQCYQCEEMKHNDCSTPEYIVNCTVNVQDTCQKEVLVKPDGERRFKSEKNLIWLDEQMFPS